MEKGGGTSSLVFENWMRKGPREEGVEGKSCVGKPGNYWVKKRACAGKNKQGRASRAKTSPGPTHLGGGRGRKSTGKKEAGERRETCTKNRDTGGRNHEGGSNYLLGRPGKNSTKKKSDPEKTSEFGGERGAPSRRRE